MGLEDVHFRSTELSYIYSRGHVCWQAQGPGKCRYLDLFLDYQLELNLDQL